MTVDDAPRTSNKQSSMLIFLGPICHNHKNVNYDNKKGNCTGKAGHIQEGTIT